MAEEKEAKKKERRPQALKRNLQSVRRRDANKSFKSAAKTALRSFQDSLDSKDKTQVQTKLSEAFSMLDKAVKKGLFKPNKSTRLKERMHKKASSLM